MPKQADEVKSNRDLEPQKLDPALERAFELEEENRRLKDAVNQTTDRLSRLEYAIGKQKKLREWDEFNDPEAQKKLGRVPSLDGKDPIIWWQRKGNVWVDELNVMHDEQVIEYKTLEGKTGKMDLMRLNAACSGNSIHAQVNNWEEYRAARTRIEELMHRYQRASGRGSKTDTVAILQEVQKLEKEIALNVTLSLDHGKTYSGPTIDVFEVVWNALV